MTRQRSGFAPPAERALVVTGGAATVTACVTILLLAARDRPDVDLWLHLRVGEFLRSGGRFALPDPFVTLADDAYRPTQWLAAVGGSMLWDSTGMAGIQVIRLIGVLAVIGFAWAAAREVAGPPAAAVAAGVTAFASSAGWGERPQLLGFTLLAIVSWLWWRAARRGSAPWVIVPLTWAWACVHGSWAIGIGLGIAMSLVAGLDEGHGARTALRMLAVPALASLAAAATPLGPRLLLEPFVVGSALRGRVAEWQPPALTNPLLVVLAVALAAVAIRWAVLRRIRIGRMVLLLAIAAMALSAVRLLAVAAILLAPLLAEAIAPRPAGRARLSRTERGIWVGALTVALAGGLWLALARPHPEPASPAIAAALERVPAGAVLAADPHVAGWVEWRFTELRLLRDLRSELYTPATAQAYEDFLQGRSDAEAYAAEHEVRAVVVQEGAMLAARLADAGWTTAVTDAGYSVLVEPKG